MKRKTRALITVMILLTLAACGQTDGEDDQDIAQSVAATQTKMAWETSLESVRQTEAAQEEEPAEAEVVEEQPPTPEPDVVHVLLPDMPNEAIASYMTDFNSSEFAADQVTYGDQFFINRYERPFTAEMEEYRGYLDIVRANLKYNPPWFYVEVFLAEPLPESSGALYAVELDLDVDNRGDFLILAAQPSGEDWTVEGLTVLEDSNEDVGGDLPLLTEELPADLAGDGYDREVVREGRGDDPDLAWIRRNPEDPACLEFAFKDELTGNTGFLWNAWSDEGLRDPALADYNDRFTFEEAGSPYPEHQFYPIQELNLVDSTCRSWYGFQPEGDEVGLCQIYTPGEGYRLCVSYTFGAGTFTQCNETCLPECPSHPGSVGSITYFCRRCKLPD